MGGTIALINGGLRSRQEWDAPLTSFSVATRWALLAAARMDGAPTSLRDLEDVLVGSDRAEMLIVTFRSQDGGEGALLFDAEFPTRLQGFVNDALSGTELAGNRSSLSQSLMSGDASLAEREARGAGQRLALRRASPVIDFVLSVEDKTMDAGWRLAWLRAQPDPWSFIDVEPFSATFDYVGGAARHPRPQKRVRVSVVRGGLSVTRRDEPFVTLACSDIRAMSIGDHDRMKTLIRAGAGGALGWAAGAAVSHEATGAVLGSLIASSGSGSRNQYVSVLGEAEGVMVAVTLCGTPEDVRLAANTLSSQRASAGLDALPELDQLHAAESRGLHERQVALLEELAQSGFAERDATDPGETMDLADQLERLAQLHASGALTEEEFAAAKESLLKPPG